MNLVGTRRADAVRAARQLLAADGQSRVNGRHSLVRGSLLIFAVLPTAVLVVMDGAGWTWLAHWVVGTAVLCTLPSVYHECTHSSMSRNRIVNDTIGVAAAALHFIPFATWRYFHLAHHANTGTNQDSEVYPARWSRWTLLTFPLTQWVFVLMLWRWTLSTATGRGPRWIRTDRQRQAVRRSAWYAATVLLALAVWSILEPKVAGLVLVPCVLSLMVASLTLVPEHFPAYNLESGEPDQLDRTGTFGSNALVRFIMWNSNFHAAHHFAPKVPAHRLPVVDRLIGPIQDPAWRWSGYGSWYAGRLRQLSWRPMDLRPPESTSDTSTSRATEAASIDQSARP